MSDSRPLRILVTGAAGYIGSRWALKLQADGHEVIGLDRDPAIVSLSRHIQADLTDPAAYADDLARIDQIHHLAAAKGDWGISSAEYYRDNLEATERLVEVAAARGMKHWIFYSTVAVLGPSDLPLDETAPLAPNHPYGASKAACEAVLAKFCQDHGATVTAIRPSVVFGAENPWNTNIFRLIEQIYSGRFILVGKGLEKKSTSYIDNLIAATQFLFEKTRTPRAGAFDIYHYTDDPVPSTGEIVDHLYRGLGRQRSRLRLPLPVASGIAVVADIVAAVARIDLPVTSARIRKFCTGTNFSSDRIRALGFVQPVSVEQAMSDTVRWYLDTYLPRQQDR